MDEQIGDAHFLSLYVEDKTEGFAGLELYRIRAENRSCVARVLYWDASGSFFFNTLNADIPLVVVEKLIAEVKATVRTT